MKKVWLDMDGTFVDLYGVPNWLNYLEHNDPTPYRDAKPLIHLATLARLLNKIQRNGIEIGIISWLSKRSTEEFDNAVRLAKIQWLKRHMPSVQFDTVHIVPYGVCKWEVCRSGILFDDEIGNRQSWQDEAYEPNKIFEVLHNLLT